MPGLSGRLESRSDGIWWRRRLLAALLVAGAIPSTTIYLGDVMQRIKNALLDIDKWTFDNVNRSQQTSS